MTEEKKPQLIIRFKLKNPENQKDIIFEKEGLAIMDKKIQTQI